MANREEIFALRMGRNTVIRVMADGEWSARDMEILYEHIGLGLRNGYFDAPLPAIPMQVAEQTKDSQP